MDKTRSLSTERNPHQMHTYSPDETYVSLVRTSPDLTTWSLSALLDEYAVLVERRWQEQTFSSHWLEDVEADVAAIANELERRISAVPSNVADAVFALRDQIRGCAERLGSPELTEGADLMAQAVLR